MTKPTIEEVSIYMTAQGGSVELAEKFFFHYESNGWKVGRNPMKNWKASVSYWKRTEKTPNNVNRFSTDNVSDRLQKW